MYDLISICNHAGGVSGGHYTAFCKNHFDKKWYEFDDSCVTPLGKNQPLVSSEAYILIYEKREDL